MSKNKQQKNKYNHYTEDFRREAVRRADDPNTSAVEVARELGIHPGQIYNWRQQYKRLSDKQFNSVQGVDYSKEESEEIRKLKREVADRKEERDFLKKAAVSSTGQCNSSDLKALSREMRCRELVDRDCLHSRRRNYGIVGRTASR